MVLIQCGASLEAVDRRCRTARDVAAEHGRKEIVHVVCMAETEKLTGEGDLGRVREVRIKTVMAVLIIDYNQVQYSRITAKLECLISYNKVNIYFYMHLSFSFGS